MPPSSIHVGISAWVFWLLLSDLIVISVFSFPQARSEEGFYPDHVFYDPYHGPGRSYYIRGYPAVDDHQMYLAKFNGAQGSIDSQLVEALIRNYLDGRHMDGLVDEDEVRRLLQVRKRGELLT
ncbi:hypothetical protein TCAL_08365 [Tigriopus californicus]|uniref:Uncharacterized protein n=1 Tax=Tigriopus californicus TaxID=6832 RepID=A0A553PHE4_TIGCA|nr:hypothetical protein TCAL_08365 [Tigriopus californicus]|eukprot:TCALIF_08365-PA protein Name:"Protein of unknown function" AED:0.00 eAED:0.00 QI:5/1/1/1/1/1/2/299/122